MPASGRVPPPCTEAASSVPTNGPTQAKEASENVSPMSSVPQRSALLRDTVQSRQDDGRNGDLEGSQQAQAEHDENHRDQPVHPRV